MCLFKDCPGKFKGILSFNASLQFYDSKFGGLSWGKQCQRDFRIDWTQEQGKIVLAASLEKWITRSYIIITKNVNPSNCFKWNCSMLKASIKSIINWKVNLTEITLDKINALVPYEERIYIIQNYNFSLIIRTFLSAIFRISIYWHFYPIEFINESIHR